MPQSVRARRALTWRPVPARRPPPSPRQPATRLPPPPQLCRCVVEIVLGLGRWLGVDRVFGARLLECMQPAQICPARVRFAVASELQIPHTALVPRCEPRSLLPASPRRQQAVWARWPASVSASPQPPCATRAAIYLADPGLLVFFLLAIALVPACGNRRTCPPTLAGFSTPSPPSPVSVGCSG